MVIILNIYSYAPTRNKIDMPTTQINNRQIAKNTVYMYIRMLLIMVVSLYTSRVVLQTLGEEDFGTYSIVGGVVVLFTFISNAMATGTQRHLSYELGKRDGDISTIFSACFKIQLWLALLIFVLAETFGLWLLNTQMNFPQGRMNIVNWLYQFSIFTCLIGVVQTTMTAALISYEKMDFYASISIIDVLVKLGVVFVLKLYVGDKLWLYGLLILLAHLLMFGIYAIYVFNKLPGIKIVGIKDTNIYKRLISFSGWSLFGSFANVGYQHGVNIIINIFFGVALNAAVGIANQINSAVSQFVLGFQQAMNPQLVQSEASKDRERQIDLIHKSSKFSFYIMFLVSFPLLTNLKFVLTTWLGQYPAHTESLTMLIIVGLMISCLSGPLWVSIYATGNIKNYQVVVSLLTLTILPIAYLIGRYDGSPETIFVVRAMNYVFVMLVQLYFLHSYIQLDIRQFAKDVIFPVALIILISFTLFLLFHSNLMNDADSIGTFLVQTFIYIAFVSIQIWSIGLKNTERQQLFNFALTYIKKKDHD